MTANSQAAILGLVRKMRQYLTREMQRGESLVCFYHPPAPRPVPAAKPARKPELPQSPLQILAREIKTCQKCGLARTRTQVVFGTGTEHPRLVLVGEAPGAEEDKQGLPFVGAAGALLTRMLEAIGLSRQEVFICNVLKCRPPGNRNPSEPEIMACSPYLRQQLQELRPELICALGTFAAQTLLQTLMTVGQLRGKMHAFAGIPLIVTYHPAALLYHPQNKRMAWEDLKCIAKQLDIPQPAINASRP